MIKLFQHISLLLVFFATYTHAQTLGFKIINEEKRVRIPFEMYNNLIVVPVVLNNQLPLKFILDTGVRTTILTQKAYSDILNLSYSRKYTISGVGANASEGIEAYITNGVSLTLPGISGDGHAMLVLEKDYLELRNYLGTDVHGVLGYEIFSRFVVKVDYDSKMLLLTTPEYFKPPRRYEEINISVEDTKPYLHSTLTNADGSEVDLKLMIDSGASHGLMLLANSSEQLSLPDNNIRCNLGRGLAGELHGQVGRVNSFAIGKRKWKDILATFPEESSLLDSLKGSKVFRNGSIGGGILSRFKVIYHYSAEKIYFKKSRGFNKEFNFNLSGLSLKAKGSRLNIYEIVEVRAGSNAAIADVKEGDLIVSVNSVPSRSLSLENIIGMLNQKENKRIRLELKRGEEYLVVKFKLESQI